MTGGTDRADGGAPVVEMCDVSKRFPGVQALESVSLDIRPGEVHAIAGENGAGKSTLMKLLSALERPSAGQICVSGEEVRLRKRVKPSASGSRWSIRSLPWLRTSPWPTTSRSGASRHTPG